MSSQWLPVEEIGIKVNAGELSAKELVENAIKSIEAKAEYKAIISVLNENALERAKSIDQKIVEGKSVGKLAGVPFIAKDNFLVFGSETTAASNILRGFNAPYQATAIEKLESEGAICVAKANLDAFAHGASTENSDFFTTKNPHDKTRVPGGSSGGSAAAVVLDMAPFALGTDTGGSIRQPASFSGCVGLKPSYGLVSRSGVVAMASSTDVIGPLTKSVDDAAFILDIIAGKDELDSTTIDRQENYIKSASNVNLSGCKFGLIEEQMGEGVDEEVKNAILKMRSALTKSGAEVVDISIPSINLALAVYYIICPAEVSSNLMRYDGQKYGYSSKDAKNLDDSYYMTRGIGFGKEAKRRIMIGTHVLSSGYYDAYYKQAQTVRTKLIDEFNRAFEEVDFMLGPVSPTTAFEIGKNNNNPLKMYLADVMTVSPNLVGNPAISLPIPVENGSLPIGLHVMARQKADLELLTVAKQIEELIA